MKIKSAIAFMSGLGMCSTLVVANEANQIADIVVTAKTQSTVETMPTAVNVITAADIQESGAASIQDVLAKVPGFTWTTNSSSLGGRKNIGLRGMDSEHVLILINGKRINSSDGFIGHSNFKVTGIDINAVKRVEVIKSAGTVLYGSNAMGGVINIITDSQQVIDYTNVTASMSSLDSRSGGETTSVTLNAGRALSDATFVEVAVSNSDRASASTGGSVVIEANQRQSTSIDLEHQLNETMSIALDYSSSAEERRESSHAEYDIERQRQGLQFNALLGTTEMELLTYSQSTDAAYHYSGAPYYWHRMSDDVNRISFSPTAWEGHVANFGLEHHKSGYKKDYVSASSADYTATSVMQTSLFAQDKLTIASGALTFGGRYDDNDQFGSQLSPEVGFSMAAGDNMRLRVNYARGFNAPNIKEADDNYVYNHASYSGGNGSQYQGNSNLKAESSNSFTVGLQSTASDGIDWAVDLYAIRAKDFISASNTGTTVSVTSRGTTSTYNVYKYENIAKANINGLEFSLSNDLHEDLFLDMNVTLMNSDNGSGQQLAYRPDVALKTSLTKYFGDDQNLIWSTNHTGNAEDGRGNAVGAYTVHNLVYNKWLANGVGLQFAVNNLTGELNNGANSMTELAGREFKFTLSRSF